MEKINFENFPSTKTPISAENLNSLQDNVETEINSKTENIEDILNKIGEVYEYTLTSKPGPFATGSWVSITEDLTTDVIPAGKYLLIFIGQLTASDTGISTLNPYLDGERTNTYTRQSIPVGASLNTNGSMPIIREFTEDSTHVVNLHQYSNVETKNGRSAVYFIRLR